MPVLLSFIFLSGWLNTRMPVVRMCARVCVRARASERACAVLWVCVLSLRVCGFLCVGSGSMCVWVRGEVSLGWPWLESWRRAEVKEEICRKDTHHFPHYYFFFFFFYYVSVSHCLLLCFFFFSFFSRASYSPHLRPPLLRLTSPTRNSPSTPSFSSR